MILVTGATGFLGRHVYGALRRAQWPARALVRDRVKYNALFPGAPPAIEADLLRLRKGDMAETRVTGIVHLAAEVWPVQRSDVKLFTQINIDGTRALLESVDPKRLEKIVLTSSFAVYGELKGTISESVKVRPNDPYGESKLEQERLVEDFAARHGISALVLRLPSLYGRGATGLTVVPAFLQRARAGKVLEVTNPNRRRQSFLHVDDAAAAVLAALESDASGVYVVAAATTPSMAELANAVADAAESVGLRRPAIRLGAEVDPPRVFTVDASKAERELNWRPRYDLVRGLAEALREPEENATPQ